MAKSDKEKDSVFVFDYFNDKKELQRFIKRNLVSGRDSIQRIRINHNNFKAIYEKWRKEVMPSIAVNWDNAKKHGLLDADFYLADVMSGDNNTILENLHVLLKSNHYELDRKIDTDGLWASKSVPFKDGMKAHSMFWAKYTRPPKREYWDRIVERRDLLVPQDVRERKGSYFTPAIWVEKSQEYLADVLGENWQEEYYVWDCCAGTGNLLAGLTNKYNIWASTLDKADVDVMLQRIEEMGQGSNLLPSHVFQFDFLNGDFKDLPEGLQDIINDEEKRKKLVIYINPPYAEAASYGGGENKRGVAAEHQISHIFKDKVGRAINELFVQFFLRSYTQIGGCTLASFSTLKYINAQNFVKFREIFTPKFLSGFICPAYTFDNVKGQFPIGFLIWDFSKKESISNVTLDVYDAKEQKLSTKTISTVPKNGFIIDWLRPHFDKVNERLAYLRFQGTDFQTKNHAFFTSAPSENDFRESKVTNITWKNLISMCVYLSVRQCIEATWLNDRDQFLYPSDIWKYDIDFKNDCLAYALFHGQNKISSKHGINHWIPFTEREVDAPDKFKSNFMAEFIHGKYKAPQSVGTLFGEEESLIPTEPIHFTPAAQAVMDAGRKIWYYYLHHKDKSNELYASDSINVNASFYDIRAYFQGRDEKGKMNNDSKDETYMALLRELRTYQKVLAKQIEKKVYQYGFLKSEVTIDPQEQVVELKNQVATLESRIKELSQQNTPAGSTVVNIYNIDTINNDNSQHLTIQK